MKGLSAESLRMVLHLEVDKTLHTNYTQYQSQPTESISFPSQIRMFPWNDIQQLCEYIAQQTQILCIHQRLFFRGKELTAYRKKKARKNKLKSTAPSLSFFGITDGCMIYLQCASAASDTDSAQSIVMYGHCASSEGASIISQCIDGLNNDLLPELSEDGEGGTYFLRNGSSKRVACFKPCDEEAGCVNNPRGRTSSIDATDQAIHCGIAPSEGHLREIAAYLFDEANGHFHEVPETMRVEIAYAHSVHKKIGSLQSFIAGEVIENFGVKNFGIRQVHKIGILDILLLNCDRNSGNVLVFVDEFGRYSLIPIDHGLSLPRCIEITTDSWVWLQWKQSKEPFDPYTTEYINAIDIEKNIDVLRKQLHFEQIVFENMRISHLVLKKGIARGLTLNEIGSIIARPDFDTKSILEELMLQAESLSIEKVRQNKHLINRIRLVAYKQRQKEKEKKKRQQQKTHIVHKFMKVPLPNRPNVQIVNKYMTLTPEPFLMNDAAGDGDDEEMSHSLNNHNETHDKAMIKPFWTPNYKASSSSTATTNSSTVTCTKQTQSQLQLLPSLFLENEHQMPPIKTYSIQRSSSIHDRDGDIDAAPPKMTIFKSISGGTDTEEFSTDDGKGLVPLSRSTSCITTASTTSFDMMSASLINHKSMMDKRREMMSASLNRLHHPNNKTNNEHKSTIIDDIEEETSSPTAARSYSSLSRTPKYAPKHESPSATSHQSQDDLITINKTSDDHHEAFGIHPIMERMAKENYEVNKYFLYYLDQLLGIQCERISNRSRKSDKHDSIYDIDTVEGSFIWKNELRKHWIRSRLERKKLMQPKPPKNPFHEAEKHNQKQTEKHTHMNGHLVYDNHYRFDHDGDDHSTQEEDHHAHQDHQEEDTEEEESEEDDGHEWFAAEGTVDYDDDDSVISDSNYSQ
eukprot:284804_1